MIKIAGEKILIHGKKKRKSLNWNQQTATSRAYDSKRENFTKSRKNKEIAKSACMHTLTKIKP
jgi:ribosomal protein L13